MTREELFAIMPAAAARIDRYLPHLNAAMDEFSINTPARQSAFLATIAHESGQLASVEENLNYTPEALMATFNKKIMRFTREQALRYGRTREHKADQVMIANIAYANREGNGDVASGDGWRYRGAGLIQLTFKNNQSACARYFGIPVEKLGDWLRTPEGACRSAAWFWKTNGCNELADRNDFQGACGVINVGDCKAPTRRIIGYAERQAFYQTARVVLT